MTCYLFICFNYVVKICPLGHIPTLQVDGVTKCQHLAIIHFLAHEFNLYGSNNMEKAVTDQVIETIREIFDGLENIMANQALNEEAKVEFTIVK